MENNNSRTQSSSSMGTFGQMIGRFIVAAIILGITAFFTPGFSINNIWALAISAIVLTVMDYLIIKFTGLHAMAFGKGFVGFVLAVVVLYATQFFVAGYSISWMAAIIGALIYGVIDYIMPGEQTM
ncbi:MAG: phage holin family protein [Clostridia bacterium]|nr:phage holin family protein [Clostridia bacterium]